MSIFCITNSVWIILIFLNWPVTLRRSRVYGPTQQRIILDLMEVGTSAQYKANFCSYTFNMSPDSSECVYVRFIGACVQDHFAVRRRKNYVIICNVRLGFWSIRNWIQFLLTDECNFPFQLLAIWGENFGRFHFYNYFILRCIEALPLT